MILRRRRKRAGLFLSLALVSKERKRERERERESLLYSQVEEEFFFAGSETKARATNGLQSKVIPIIVCSKITPLFVSNTPSSSSSGHKKIV